MDMLSKGGRAVVATFDLGEDTMRYRYHWGLALLAIVALLLTACGGRPAQATVQAVKIEPIEGSSFKRLTLTDQAVKRTGHRDSPCS